MLFLLIALLLVAGCASTPPASVKLHAGVAPPPQAVTATTPAPSAPRRGKEKTPATAFPDPAGNCSKFCAIIHTCAKRFGHERLSFLLCRLARCETGHKCTGRSDSRTGRYAGPFQFSGSLWREKCHQVFEAHGIDECDSDDAVYNICCSTICAAEIIAHQGTRPWPTCAKKIRRRPR